MSSSKQFLSAGRIITATMGDLRRHGRRLWLIVAVIIIPVDLLNLSATIAASPRVSGLLTIATLFMNVALIYAVMNVRDEGEAATVGQAYYQGTANLLKFLLVSLTLALTLIPFALGLLIYGLGSTTGDNTAAPLGEQLLVALFGLILALPTLWLLARYTFALYAVVADGLSPIAALKHSRQVSLGHFWLIVRRLLVLLVFVIILAFVAIIPSAVVGLFLHNAQDGLQAMFEIIATLIILPFGNLYLSRLYRELEAAA